MLNFDFDHRPILSPLRELYAGLCRFYYLINWQKEKMILASFLIQKKMVIFTLKFGAGISVAVNLKNHIFHILTFLNLECIFQLMESCKYFWSGSGCGIHVIASMCKLDCYSFWYDWILLRFESVKSLKTIWEDIGYNIVIWNLSFFILFLSFLSF